MRVSQQGVGFQPPTSVRPRIPCPNQPAAPYPRAVSHPRRRACGPSVPGPPLVGHEGLEGRISGSEPRPALAAGAGGRPLSLGELPAPQSVTTGTPSCKVLRVAGGPALSLRWVGMGFPTPCRGPDIVQGNLIRSAGACGPWSWKHRAPWGRTLQGPPPHPLRWPWPRAVGDSARKGPEAPAHPTPFWVGSSYVCLLLWVLGRGEGRGGPPDTETCNLLPSCSIQGGSGGEVPRVGTAGVRLPLCLGPGQSVRRGRRFGVCWGLLLTFRLWVGGRVDTTRTGVPGA